MTIVVSVSRNHTWVSKLFTVIKSASMMPIMIICSLVMMKFLDVMAEITMPYFLVHDVHGDDGVHLHLQLVG